MKRRVASRKLLRECDVCGKGFDKVCEHKVVDEVWSYMSGEAVMEPDHDVCRYCEEVVR